MGDTGGAFSGHPELLSGGTTENAGGFEFARLDLFGDDFITAAGAVWHFAAVDIPGAHVLLRDSAREFIEETATGGASFEGVGFDVAAVGAEGSFFCFCLAQSGLRDRVGVLVGYWGAVY